MPVMPTTIQPTSTFALPVKFAASSTKDKPTLLVVSRRKKQSQGRAVRPESSVSSDWIETQREREMTYEWLTTHRDYLRSTTR